MGIRERTNSSRYLATVAESWEQSIEDTIYLRNNDWVIDGEISPVDGRMVVPYVPEFALPPIKLDETLRYCDTIFYDGLKVKLTSSRGRVDYQGVPAAGIYLVDSGTEVMKRRVIITDETGAWEVNMNTRKDQARFDEIVGMAEDFNMKFEMDDEAVGDNNAEEEGDYDYDEGQDGEDGVATEYCYEEDIIDQTPDPEELARMTITEAIEEPDWMIGRVVRRIKQGWKVADAVGSAQGRFDLAVEFD